MVTLLCLLACDPDDPAPGTPDTAGTPADTDTAGDTDTADTDTARDTDTAEDTDTSPADADGDGHLPPEDCDDGDARVYPGAPDGCDALDQDCDGVAQPEGSCGQMVTMAEGAAGWWEGGDRLGHLRLLEAVMDHTGDGIVDPLVSLFCEAERGCGGTVALLPGRVPGSEEPWTTAGGPSWTGDSSTEYQYFAGGAGDFDGDGSQDLYATTLGCDPYARSLYVMLGPADRWGSGGRYLLDGADGWWQQHQAYDCFGVGASGGYDIDGDGRDDLLVETQGIAGSPDFEGSALSFVPGRSGPLPMGASINDEVWFTDDVSLGTYALLPDMDGDGAGEAAAVAGSLGALHHPLAFFDPEVLASGAAGASLEAALAPVPSSESFQLALLAGRAGVGDVNGDGFEDIALSPRWSLGDSEYQWCFAHLLGGSDLRSAALDDRLGGFACFEHVRGVRGASHVGGDLDRDGIADVVYDQPQFGDAEYAACIVPSSRHPAAGWALADEVRPYCFGSTDQDDGASHGGLADLDGDGLPEILGSEVWWTDPSTPDAEMAGRVLVMPGFEVPWDDDRRW